MEDQYFQIRDDALKISPEIVDMSSVVSEAEKAAGYCREVQGELHNFREEVEDFIQTVIDTDAAVADLIALRNEQFYKEHEWMRPEREKDWWDKAADWFKGVAEWCKEHWKTIAIIALAVVAIVCMFIPELNALGAAILYGMVLGGAFGGINGLLTGWSEGKTGWDLFGSMTQGLGEGMLSGGAMAAFTWALGPIGSALGFGGELASLCGSLSKAADVLLCADMTFITFESVGMISEFSFGENSFSNSVKDLMSNSI